MFRMNKVEKIQKLIDKHGLTDASKLSGLPRYELVRIADYPINHEMASIILSDLMTEGLLPKTYENSELSTSFDGVFYWNTVIKDNSLTYILTTMATPFWDGGDKTPIESDWVYVESSNGEQIVDKELNGEYFEELKSRTEFDGIEDLLTWFKHFYLPRVQKVIIKNYSDLKENMDLV